MNIYWKQFRFTYVSFFRKIMFKCLSNKIRLLRNVYLLISKSSLYCIALKLQSFDNQ